MSDFTTYTQKQAIRTPIAVYGIGLSGSAVVNALLNNRMNFTAWDDREAVRKEQEEKGVVLRDYFLEGLDDARTLIPAAGIPPSNPVIQQAYEQGLDIISDLDLLYATATNRQYIGITGTNGKSTTTALLGHIFQSAGKDAAVGGNIGLAAMRLPVLSHKGCYILEVSSYQLTYTSRTVFDVAILLNITPDHVDWHGSMANYVAAKESLFHKIRPDKKQTAIIGIDTPASERIYLDLLREGHHNLIPVSCEKTIEGGIYIKDNAIIDDTNHQHKKVLTFDASIPLHGRHNHQNIMAAYAAASSLGIKTEDVITAVKSFSALPHRQQPVRTIGRVAYINDSKATNFEAASRAIQSYHNIHLILGGKAKEGGIQNIENYADHISHIYLIGEAEKSFAKVLKKKIPFTKCHTMQKAVNEAHKNAQKQSKQAVVLLSPACASFDQYINYESRGEDFVKKVMALKETP